MARTIYDAPDFFASLREWREYEQKLLAETPDADSKDLPFAIQAARQHIELMERAELSFLLGLEKETPRWEHSLSTPVPKHFNKVNQPRGAH